MAVLWAVAAVTATHVALAKDLHQSDFRQQSSEPIVAAGSPPSSSLKVSWDTTGDRAAPKILGYELQYASVGHGGGGDGDTALWQTVDGSSKDTWEISIQVDGFDRSTGRTHTVQDGWFTLEISRSYPKPSPLPDLRLETEPIAWDDTWAAVEANVHKALRDSEHPQYASWTAAVVRCDETEERGGNHWAGGCPFRNYGGFTWHLRLSPPANGALTTHKDFPDVTVAKETITAKWSGEGDQVTSTRYGFSPSEGELDLVDPFFCQEGSCLHLLEGLRSATPYLVRLRAYNRNGFGPWKLSTTDMSLGSARAMMPGIFTEAMPAVPIPKPPRLSSSTSSSLTVFVDTVGEDYGAATEVEAYEFEIQPYEEDGYRGDAALWTPVLQKASDFEQGTGPIDPSPLITATELSPSTTYRFRVRAWLADGVSTVSDVSEMFTTGPGVPKFSPSAPAVKSVTSSTIVVGWSSWAEDGDEDTKNGGKYGFEVQWERLGSGYWRQATDVTLDSESQEWQANAERLEPYALHRFRVRAVNSVGAGEWSTASAWVRTEPDLSFAGDGNLDSEPAGSGEVPEIPESVLLSASGDGRMPGHAKDFDYYHGVGIGGQVGLNGNGGSGGGGAAVIVTRVPGVSLPLRTPFFFTGAPELYAVPKHSGVTSVTLKLWGAGGGGVLTPVAGADVYDGGNGTSNATQVLGGGGGFLQVEVTVSPGEMLDVLVGGGGGASRGEAGGVGGFNGGQAGGRGGSGAAGGGGSTSVHRTQGNRLVAAAGGGGGAGNAEVCCAGGGAGGGVRGSTGGSPAFAEAVSGTGGGGECKNGWCSASEAVATSYEGIENWITTGGGGGTTVHGGLRGNSDVFDWVDGGGGRQGAISSPRAGDTSMPVVFAGTSSRTATPGQSLAGGIGADGPRGGGGGGGGFYGGGGGGSGAQGAGGGGGSSYADISELAVEDTPSGWGREESVVRVVEVGESWAEVEWDRVMDAVPGEEPVFYEVEVSKGHGSEDFYPSATVDALGGGVPSLDSGDPRTPGGSWNAVLRAFLLDLGSSSDYNVRIIGVSRLGRGRPSASLSFSTEALPTNEWKQVIPRASRVEGRGRGLSGPDLGEEESWDTDLAAIEEEGGGFSNPPTELRKEFPSPRSGHTLAVVAGKVYMFGGLSSNTKCSSAMVGSTALGDTPGGVITQDCIGADSFSAELWEFDPPLRQWTQVLVGASGNGAPGARSGHTASVSGSKMIVFGGRGNASDAEFQDGQGSRTALLGDEWEIDLDPSQHVTVATNSSTAIREGGQTFIPLVVIADPADTQQTEAATDTVMCVSDLTVAVHIDHGCTRQLRLTLYGPGPPTGDTSHLGNTARAEPAVLFAGHGGTDGVAFGSDYDATSGGPSGYSSGGCVDGMDVSFTDSAESGVWECCGEGSLFTGSFKAIDRLLVGQFLHMPAEGEWTLGVLDTSVGGSNGTLVSWSLDVEMRPCDWRSSLRWNNITASTGRSSPTPRAHHVAACVDGGFFISGGTGTLGALSDLWRRRNTSSDWTLLAEGSSPPLMSTGPFNPHGASIVVSPWGVLSIGGMLKENGVGETLELWVLDPASNFWRSVSGGGNADLRPPGRYLGAAAIAKGLPDYSTINGTSHERDAAGLLLFGGKDDWRRLDDLWWLKLRSISVSTSISTRSFDIQGSRSTRTPGVHVQAVDPVTTPRPQSAGGWMLAESGRDERCAHVRMPGTANGTWHASCGDGADGVGGDGSCTMNTVLRMAWCLGEYQAIGSPQ